jgi:hypothetical protein
VFVGVPSDVPRVDVEVTIVTNKGRRLAVEKGIAVTGPTPLIVREP